MAEEEDRLGGSQEVLVDLLIEVMEVLSCLLLLPCWEGHQLPLQREPTYLVGMSDKWAVLSLLCRLLRCQVDPEMILQRLSIKCLETFLSWYVHHWF